jgi:hypothetical protein
MLTVAIAVKGIFVFKMRDLDLASSFEVSRAVASAGQAADDGFIHYTIPSSLLQV